MGDYTVKKGNFFIHSFGTQSTLLLGEDRTWNWNKHLWLPPLLPKLKFFLWKIATDSLPTGANLQKRGLRGNTACKRCGAEETISHILFQCDIAQEVWKKDIWPFTVNITDETSLKELLQASLKWVSLPPLGSTTNLLPWICWNLWIARNLLIFENRTITSQEILCKALLAAKEWENAQLPTLPAPPTRSTAQMDSTTSPRDLPPSTIYCNTDASWKAETKSAGLEWVFTQPDGQEISRGSSVQDHVSSALLAEALAVRESLIHAASLDITQICLRTDSQVLFRAITTRRRPSELFGILSDVDSLVFPSSSSFTFYRFLFIPRSRNGLADSIANACLSLYLDPRP